MQGFDPNLMTMTSTDTNPVETAKQFYRNGDYRSARRIAKQVIADEQAGRSEKDEAAKILKATGYDPAVIAAFLVTFGVLLYLTVRYVF